MALAVLIVFESLLLVETFVVFASILVLILISAAKIRQKIETSKYFGRKMIPLRLSVSVSQRTRNYILICGFSTPHTDSLTRGQSPCEDITVSYMSSTDDLPAQKCTYMVVQ